VSGRASASAPPRRCPRIQLLGYALGAATSGVVANLTGLVAGAPRAAVELTGFGVCAAFLPLAALGVGRRLAARGDQARAR
jgi:hypothetical protein